MAQAYVPKKKGNANAFEGLDAQLMASMLPQQAQPQANAQPKQSMNQMMGVQEDAAAKKKKGELANAKLALLKHVKLVDNKQALKPNRKGNEVTEQELAQYSELFANITRGDTSIKFAHDDANELENYKKGTLAEMAKMMSTGTGRTLLSELAGGKHTTTIQPTAQGPHATSVDQQGAHDPTKGSAANVHFNPGVEFPKAQTGLSAHATADTALLHEMVHAHHYVHGKRQKGLNDINNMPLGHKDMNSKIEEYATVGLGDFANDKITENSYRAQMRENHADDESMQEKYAHRDSYN